MAQTLAGKDQWYVVHVLSGQENKVRENILKRVKTEEMGDLVYDVLVPTDVVFHPRHTRRHRVCRNEGQTDPDATIGSGQHVGANERARRKGETESQL